MPMVDFEEWVEPSIMVNYLRYHIIFLRPKIILVGLIELINGTTNNYWNYETTLWCWKKIESTYLAFQTFGPQIDVNDLSQDWENMYGKQIHDLRFEHNSSRKVNFQKKQKWFEERDPESRQIWKRNAKEKIKRENEPSLVGAGAGAKERGWATGKKMAKMRAVAAKSSKDDLETAIGVRMVVWRISLCDGCGLQWVEEDRREREREKGISLSFPSSKGEMKKKSLNGNRGSV